MAVEITVNGREVPLASLDTMTFDELDLLTEMTGFDGATAAATAIEQLSPKAWRAVILISVQRVDPAATADDLAGVKLFEITEQLEAHAKAEKKRLEEEKRVEGGAVPPTSPESDSLSDRPEPALSA
jgi:hypothetical protein